ncbi:MAG: PadR family transcriptional regulator [Hyphomicrobiales bacterium]|nr:PadR family transcriptional regulator [Hyphomicrobiales bacterium]MDE2017469.1 PadR family transcriptional regulator [Hyphomicrobiales bacterium]
MPPPFGPPFGHGHGFGPFGPWRGRRMFDHGALRLLTLSLVADAPRHGYDIIRELSDRFHGAYRPSPGSIYPILAQLAEAGMIEAQAQGRQKLFAATADGRAHLDARRGELDAIRARLDATARPMDGGDLGSAIRAFRGALMSKLRGGLDAERADKLRHALDRARREIEDA